MKAITGAIIAAITIVSAHAESAPNAGGEKSHNFGFACRSPELEFRAICSAYGQGVVLGIVISEINNRRQDICLPKTYTTKDLLDAQAAFLAAHPSAKQMDDAALLYSALMAAWPCVTAQAK